MKDKNLVSLGAALLLASALAGCAHKPPSRSITCTGPVCRVEVSMTDCRNVVVPEEILVKRPATPAPVTILWQVRGGRLARDNGIYIKHDGDPADQVTDLRELPAEAAWRMQQKRAPGTKIGYGVNVLDAKGKACPPVDPFVVNEP